MKKLQIEIDGKQVDLVFSFKVIRLLGEAWGCNGPVAVMQKFGAACSGLVDVIGDVNEVEAKAAAGQTFEVPFDTVMLFADIIRFSAKAADESCALDPDLCAEYIFANSAKMGEIVKLFVESVPKVTPQPEKKQKPVTAK